MVTVKVLLKEPSKSQTIKTDVEVNFAGQTKIYKNVPIKVEMASSQKAKVSGQVPLHLSHFKVEKPSLLGMAISDNVEVDFNMTWAQASP